MRGRRVHGIIYPLDAAVAEDESEPLQIAHAVDREGGERQCLLQSEALVADDLERQSQPGHQLSLVRACLRREPEHNGADLLEPRIKIAEALGLRRRAVGAGDIIPATRVGDAGPPGPGVAVDDRGSAHAGEVDVAAPCGGQRDVWHAPAALQVAGATVVEKDPWRLAHWRGCSTSQSSTSAAFLSGGKTG